MKSKKPLKRQYLCWQYCERVLRVIEVAAIILAALLIIQIPGQLQEWKSAQESRSMELLLRLEEPLKTPTNNAISERIEKNLPLLKTSKGPFTEDQLETYLNDLTSICDAYQRELISLESVHEWYGDYLTKTYKNSEVQGYLKRIRMDSSEYYGGLDTIVSELDTYYK